ncbi:MAG TPA: response regulator [Paracoccaceae bacterium]|nr:response regulator [Paracoccaceae bacterium]
MAEILRLPEFWSAVSALVWPLALLVLVLALRAPIAALLSRETVKLSVAGVEISVADAARRANADLVKLQERVAELESRLELDEEAWAEAGGPSPTPDAAVARTPSRSFSILWVDDHPANNAFLVSRLEEEGLRVRGERTTADAMRALGQEPLDVVVTDLGREEEGRRNAMAGLDLIRAMRAAGHGQPVMVYAGVRALEHREALQSAGAEVVTGVGVDVFKFVAKHRDAA